MTQACNGLRTPCALRSEVVTITPELAQEWLLRNTHNRLINQPTVAKYARDMAAGEWRLTHQGIGFSVDGTLLDGQHRLLAIVRTGVTVEMLVTWGLTDESQEVMDDQRVRRIPQQLALAGVQRSKDIAAWVVWLNALDIGSFTKDVKLSLAAVKQVMALHAEAIAWGIECFRGPRDRSGLQRATIVAPMVWAFPGHREAIARFAHQVRTGEGLFAGDPAMTLRNIVFSGRSRSVARVSDQDHARRGRQALDVVREVRATLRAAQAFVLGQRLAKIYPDEGEALRAIEFFRDLRERRGARTPPTP